MLSPNSALALMCMFVRSGSHQSLPFLSSRLYTRCHNLLAPLSMSCLLPSFVGVPVSLPFRLLYRPVGVFKHELHLHGSSKVWRKEGSLSFPASSQNQGKSGKAEHHRAPNGSCRESGPGVRGWDDKPLVSAFPRAFVLLPLCRGQFSCPDQFFSLGTHCLTQLSLPSTGVLGFLRHKAWKRRDILRREDTAWTRIVWPASETSFSNLDMLNVERPESSHLKAAHFGKSGWS
jgi:hypothetical protein